MDDPRFDNLRQNTTMADDMLSSNRTSNSPQQLSAGEATRGQSPHDQLPSDRGVVAVADVAVSGNSEETNINQFTATADFASLHRTFNLAEGNSIGEATPPRTQSPHDPLPVCRTLPRSRGSPVGTSSLSSGTEDNTSDGDEKLSTDSSRSCPSVIPTFSRSSGDGCSEFESKLTDLKNLAEDMASFKQRMTPKEAADTREMGTELGALVEKVHSTAIQLNPLNIARSTGFIQEIFKIAFEIALNVNLDTAQAADQLSSLAERMDSITKQMIDLFEEILNGARPQTVDRNSAHRYFKNKSKNMPLLVKVLKKITKN
ncbi:uncharacterized protein LOC116346241 isoform X2 [Contarinia nasturtii]|uniref:uncharacterized protein LOC116346241 isoform X2 n=1 Tax=Contarinia nasturtii TaxID=265458 RepID=UPI0012D46D4F|nr:uncharacterized protein LOC116346241 isoform X2 [Contarinia nasturtii]XP_031632038.1 uncharacterized protein LOC116346241 isoform X2 [Contarinia nasturtii]